MRIDKYLWAVRYYKTRSLAAQACKKGRIKIENISVKPSKEIFVGTKITLVKNQIQYQLAVMDTPKNRVSAKLVPLYCKDSTPEKAFEHLTWLKSSQEYYRKKGTGRPTKKDRRVLEKQILNYE